MSDQSTIDPNWSINEILQRHPGTVGVFNAFGIDSCCGGGASLFEAAYRDGADPEALLHELRRAVADATADAL